MPRVGVKLDRLCGASWLDKCSKKWFRQRLSRLVLPGVLESSPLKLSVS